MAAKDRRVSGTNGSTYEVRRLVRETAQTRVYLATEVKTGRSCLLEAATDIEYNASLERAAFALRELHAKAEELEAEYEPKREFPDERLNYGIGLPLVLDSFVPEGHGDRRVNVYAFMFVDDVGQMMPIGNIARDNTRVDLRTSAWMEGKALKILAFAHAQGFKVGALGPNDVLTHPDKHYVVLFNWRAVTTFPNGVPPEESRNEVMAITRTVIDALGGDASTRIFTDDGEEGFDQYVQRLLELAAGSQHSAGIAHADFYRLIREQLNWRGFHPFTTHPRQDKE